MARGFESKDVEFQQAEAERRAADGPERTPEDRQALAERRTLELALTNARSQRAAAAHPRHRQMLDEAIAELESRLHILTQDQSDESTKRKR